MLARYARNDPRRRPPPAGLLRSDRLTRRPRLLRPIRARGTGHHAALRQLANRLVGILHGCLKTGTPYDEAHRLAPPHSSRRLTARPWDV